MWSRLYRTSLSLYPADYRARYGREMTALFVEASRSCAAGSRTAWATREIASLWYGALREWIIKGRTDPMRRGRRLPDCRLMRPVGVLRQEWAAGIDNFATMAEGFDDE